MSDNKKAKITGFRGVERLDYSRIVKNLDNRGSDNTGSTVLLSCRYFRMRVVSLKKV